VADGALFGNPGQLVVQGTAILAAIAYSGVCSFVLLKLIGLVLPLRVDATDEAAGLDIAAHGEEAYMHVGGATAIAEPALPSAAAPVFSAARAEG
jgi:Amt family ammonium transporter